MASEMPVLRDDNGLPVRVGLTQLGALGINVTVGMTSVLACFSGDRLTEFRNAVKEATDGQ